MTPQRLQRLVRLRSTLHEQSMHRLGTARKELDDSRDAHAQIQQEICDRASSGTITAPMLWLLDDAAHSVAHTIQYAQRSHEQAASDARERGIEKGQMEHLLEKSIEREAKAEERREQTLTETWTQNVWSSR